MKDEHGHNLEMIQICKYKTNILQTLMTMDPQFNYYGRSGTLWLRTQDADHKITVSARIRNGNYGEAYDSINWIDANTCHYTRGMKCLDVVRNSTYRTAVGLFNSTNYSATLYVWLNDMNNGFVGGMPQITLAPHQFYAFDPFVFCSAPAGDYEGLDFCLYMISTAAPDKGIMVYASTANNYTNDTDHHAGIQGY